MIRSIATIARCLTASTLVFLTSCTKTPEPCLVVDKGKTAKVNEEVQFNASCTANADTYMWEFDDGNTDNGAIVKHKYAREGEYNIKLTVSNSAKSVVARYAITIVK